MIDYPDLIQRTTEALLAIECAVRESILYGGDPTGILTRDDARNIADIEHLAEHEAAEAEWVALSKHHDKWPGGWRDVYAHHHDEWLILGTLRRRTEQIAELLGVKHDA